MSGLIKTIFSGPPKPQGPDPELVEAQKRQASAAEKQQADLQAQEDAVRRNLSARNTGRNLLSFVETGDTGVSDKLGD